MASPVGSLMSTHAVRVEEVIGKSIHTFLPSLDSVWEDSIVSAQNVGNPDMMGRDYLINKPYTGGLTGVIEPGGPGTDFTLYGDPQNTAVGAKLFTQGLGRTFPDASRGANQSVYRLTIPMRSMVTNLLMTLDELQLEANPHTIGQIIAPKLSGFARHIGHMLCNYWYVSQNSSYALSGAGIRSTMAAEDSNTTLVIDLNYGNLAVDRFEVGMQVQFYTYDGATLISTAGGDSIFFVTAVDALTGKVKFKSLRNQAVDAANFINSCSNTTGQEAIIVPANSKGDSSTPYSSSPYFTGIAGVNSWLKFGTGSNDNYLLGAERAGTNYGFSGNIDVTVHPEFKSLHVAMGNTPLTEHMLRKILRRWHSAKRRHGYSIDTLIASDGVWMAYEAQKIGRQWYDRTGQLSNMNNEGSKEGFSFTFDGRTYEGVTSSWVEKGTVYGIKRKNNWTRYVPPDPKGVKRFDKVPGWNPFRFVAPALTGTGANQIPIFAVGSSGRSLTTVGAEMPGMLRMQLVPEQACGLKITGVSEDRLYANDSSVPPSGLS